MLIFVAAESILAEADLPVELVDLSLLNSLTSFQLFVACKEIPEDCDAFRTKFLGRVKVALVKAREEGKRSR